jgi:hypothetical protein
MLPFNRHYAGYVGCAVIVVVGTVTVYRWTRQVEVMFVPAAGTSVHETKKIVDMFQQYVDTHAEWHRPVECVTSDAAFTAPLDRRLTVRVYANQSGRGCRLERIPDSARRDINVELSQGTGSNIVAPDRIITCHYEKGPMEGPETEQCFATLLVLAAAVLERAVALS